MLLPPELVEQILQWLPEDASLLRPFALVSRAWTVGVQNRLYRRIIIAEKNKWTRLHKRLRAFPYLRPLVRELDFVLFVSFGKKQRFDGLFPRLETVRFTGSGANAELLSALAAGARDTLRSLYVTIDSEFLFITFRQAMQGTSWRDITVRLIESQFAWRRRVDVIPSFGTLAVQSLSITVDSNPHFIFTVLRNTDLRDVTCLKLSCCSKFSSEVLDMKEACGGGQPLLPDPALHGLERVSVELKDYARIRNLRKLRTVFGAASHKDKFHLVVGRNKPADMPDGTILHIGHEQWQVVFS